MVKGVNRQVLEIRETGSVYFERAFFFVKPEYADTDEQKLRAAAERLLPGIDKVPKPKRKRSKALLYWVFGALAALAGSGTILAFIFAQ